MKKIIIKVKLMVYFIIAENTAYIIPFYVYNNQYLYI